MSIVQDSMATTEKEGNGFCFAIIMKVPTGGGQKMIVNYADVTATPVGDKCLRRVLIPGPAMMLVEFRFQKGGVGTPHKHEEHEQVGYIAKGSFEITVDGKVQVVHAGDTYYAARNVMHGVVALEEDSVIIDTFTPPRADFLPQK